MRNENDPIICFCHSVRESEIVAAIRAGATDHGKIQSETLASTGCGGCEGEVLRVLEETLASASSSATS